MYISDSIISDSIIRRVEIQRRVEGAGNPLDPLVDALYQSVLEELRKRQKEQDVVMKLAKDRSIRQERKGYPKEKIPPYVEYSKDPYSLYC